jgi:hypothetical protein
VGPIRASLARSTSSVGFPFGLRPLMKLATIVLMVVPFAFASACYLFPYTGNAEVILGFWAACTVACLGWGFLIRRRHPGLAWACVAIGFLQLALMLLPALKKGKSHGPGDKTAHSIGLNHRLRTTPSGALLFARAQWPGAPIRVLAARKRNIRL